MKIKKEDLIVLLNERFGDSDEIEVEQLQERIQEMLEEQACQRLEKLVLAVLGIMVDSDPKRYTMEVEAFKVTLRSKKGRLPQNTLEWLDREKKKDPLHLDFSYSVNVFDDNVEFSLDAEN